MSIVDAYHKHGGLPDKHIMSPEAKHMFKQYLYGWGGGKLDAQRRFLCADTPEILYGGALGGSMADALYLTALCLGDNPGPYLNPDPRRHERVERPTVRPWRAKDA